MKFRLIIDKTREEEVIVYSHKETKLTDEIKRIVENDAKELIGYIEREAYKLNLSEVFCFVAEDNNVYALTGKDKLRLKFRLYQLEEMLGNDFIKINLEVFVMALFNFGKKKEEKSSGLLESMKKKKTMTSRN